MVVVVWGFGGGKEEFSDLIFFELNKQCLNKDWLCITGWGALFCHYCDPDFETEETILEVVYAEVYAYHEVKRFGSY